MKSYFSQDTMMMGVDYYQTEEEIATTLAEGKVPIGVGKDTKILLVFSWKNSYIIHHSYEDYYL